MADLENGLFSGQGSKQNTGDPSIKYRFVTAVVKGNTGNQWAIRGGNAASGSLSTFYNGGRPSGYNPMHKEGAIILGIGGDNSHGAVGTFYEGAMTSGYPSDTTENSVQADIVAAAYSTTAGSSSPPPPPPPPSASTTAAPPPPSTGGATQSEWGQCGGIGYSGPTKCSSPYTCTTQNAYYAQCV
jgi:non-reducing end alpha-L-arabinofuranosidase